MRNGTLRLIASWSVCLIATACAKEPPTQNLGRCWNINTAGFGPVTGEGVFVSSGMHGLGFTAPDCDDRDGPNRFELSKAADSALSKFREGRLRWPRYASFSFEGRIYQTARGNVLVISKIERVKESVEPKWREAIKQQYRSRGRP